MRATIFILPALINLNAAEDPSALVKTFAGELEKLDPIIGSFPPHITSESHLKEVKSTYEKLKARLDSAIHSFPENNQLLFQRGALQSMGHNMDVPGAFEASQTDFKLVLSRNPKSISATVALGLLLVNSDQKNAHEAEALFRKAQELSASQLLEDAQRGLYFALYYQGKMNAALAQIEFLLKNWPEDEQYLKLREITKQVIERSKKLETAK